MSEFRTWNLECKLWSSFHFPSYMSNMSPILHEADIQCFLSYDKCSIKEMKYYFTESVCRL